MARVDHASKQIRQLDHRPLAAKPTLNDSVKRIKAADDAYLHASLAAITGDEEFLAYLTNAAKAAEQRVVDELEKSKKTISGTGS